MSNLDEKTELKKYLLGNLKEVEAIEKRILADEDYFQELEMVEEELIQDFADGNLSASEKALFEQNFVLTPERANKLSFAKNLRTYIDKNPERISKPKKNGLIDSLRAFFSSPIPVAFAVLLIAGIAGYFVWNQYYRESEILASLNKVYKNERPTEGRITGFDYAPKTEGTRGNNDKTENLDLVSAKARAAESVLKNQTAESYHELGRVYLAEKNFDEAIRNFEKGIKKNPNIARLHNDLGVALMEKANTKEDGKLALFTKASEEFAVAMVLDDKLLDAYFNQALCINLQNVLPNQAKEAWENYLKLDSTSKWADEAREKLNKIDSTQPISKTKEDVLQDFLQAKKDNDANEAWRILSRNRGLSSGKLIPQQLAFLFIDSKVIDDENKANEILDGLVYAGEIEEEKSGDLFWRDLAKYYKNVSVENISNLKLAKDRYFKTFLDVNATIKNADYRKSINELIESQNLYLQADNYLEAKLIDFLLGYLLNRDTKLNESNMKLAEVEEFSKKAKYKWLETQALTWLASNDLSERKLSLAQLKTKKTLAKSLETYDLAGQQKAYAQLSEINSLLGQFEKSFNDIEENLKLGRLPEASLPEKWRSLNSIGSYLYKQKQFHSTLIYEKEALVFARQFGDKSFEFSSLVSLGATYSALGKFDDALNYINQGKEIAETFLDNEYKNKCIGHVNLQLGHIERQKGMFNDATEYYQKAANYYDSGTFRVYSYEAHRGILLSSLSAQNDQTFQDELPKILDIFKSYRDEILEEQNRNSFFDNEQDVYDIAIDYEFRNANFATAFDYSEESRSRSLLDLQNSDIKVENDLKQIEIKFSKTLAEPLKLVEIQKEMPEDVQILEYSVLNDKVLIWSITKDTFNIAKTDISSHSLQEKVLSYRNLLAQKNADSNEQLDLSKELYQLLITPIKDRLDTSKHIFIIADKSLTKLSFATLFSDKYLIEEFNISYSPSANVFLHCTRKAKEFDIENPENLLVVGNPAFNQTEYENELAPLPSAKVEAEEVAKIYKTNPITEKSATKQVIKEELKAADVFHFAGHYLVDEHSPLLSNFVLAGERKSNLANHEIIGEKLSHIRLIVLSACDTGVEKFYNGEGMIGASRTFLATGVPIVIASQWKVDSEANEELMIGFHQFRKNDNLPTAEALRQSQLQMIQSGKYQQPFYWAAFASIGGYTKF